MGLDKVLGQADLEQFAGYSLAHDSDDEEYILDCRCFCDGG